MGIHKVSLTAWYLLINTIVLLEPQHSSEPSPGCLYEQDAEHHSRIRIGTNGVYSFALDNFV